MRFLLGNVELLLVPEMDLSHPGRGILANFRNASAGLWRLHPLRAGTVHVEELFLAQRTTACAGIVNLGDPSGGDALKSELATESLRPDWHGRITEVRNQRPEVRSLKVRLRGTRKPARGTRALP